ncbi:hypothetical protein [Bacillus subtilis]|uniref:hypothetical protein n=1 Tax=Bacillus subtilis TaxID=1423 RepID=UPI0031F58146
MSVANVNWQDISQFISSILNSKFIITLLTSWPIAVVIIIVLLRKGLLDKLDQLNSLNYKDGTATFVKEELGKANGLMASNKDEEEQSEEKINEKNNEREGIKSIAEVSPEAAILTSWLKVEACINKLLEKQNPESNFEKNPPKKKIGILKNTNNIPPVVIEATYHLSTIRNEAVHGAKIGYDEALNYYDLCIKVINALEDN